MGGSYTPAASHNPIIQTSHWEGQTAKGHSEYERSGATGSSDDTSHLPAHLYSPRVDQQPHTSRQCSCRVGLWDWESPLTPLPPSLLPLAIRTLMHARDRLPEAETMAVGQPAIPGGDGTCPPSGRPVTQSLDRRVDTPLGHLVISPPPQPLESPHHSLAVLRGLLP